MEIKDIFRTRMKTIEAVSLLEGIKPGIRQGFYEEEIPLLKKFCDENRLFLVLSNFKIILQEEGKCFSNKGISASKDDPRRGMYFAYISEDEMTSYNMALSELRKDHATLGRYLGYPACCCDFFNDHNSQKEGGDYDYSDIVARYSEEKDYPFFMNIFKKDDDSCVISHFPCSLGCKESLSLGRDIFRSFEKYNKKDAEKMKKFLSNEVESYGKKFRFTEA